MLPLEYFLRWGSHYNFQQLDSLLTSSLFLFGGYRVILCVIFLICFSVPYFKPKHSQPSPMCPVTFKILISLKAPYETNSHINLDIGLGIFF